MRTVSRPTLSCLIVALACLSLGGARADPIHADKGAFWHHDSGWVFPAKIGEFELVGIPQDVAGSRDAVAHYARVIDGARIIAAVDVYPADSAAAEAMTAENPGEPLSEGQFAVRKTGALGVNRRVYCAEEGRADVLVAVYFVSTMEWRVRIRIAGAKPEMLPAMDAFVAGQRWETLAVP